jgi:hypothetical protein
MLVPEKQINTLNNELLKANNNKIIVKIIKFPKY